MSNTLESKLLTSPDGTLIYAEAQGNPSLPAVIFIHAFTLSHICFDVLFSDPKWTEHVYMLRYDMRGHGRSGKPIFGEAYHSRRMAEDFLTVLKEFHVDKVFLAGWSMGATIAADLYAIHHEHVLLGLIYLAGVPHMGPLGVTICKPRVNTFIPGLKTTDDLALALKTAGALIDSCFPKSKQLPYRTRGSWIAEVLSQPPEVRQLFVTRLQNFDLFLRKGTKELQLLMLHGSDDRVINGHILEKELRPLFEQRMVVRFLINAGHAFFVHAPDRVREEVLSFVLRVLEQPQHLPSV